MATKRVEIGKAFGYGWQGIKKNFWYFVVLAILVIGIKSIFSSEINPALGLVGIFVSAWLIAGYLKILFNYYDHDEKKLPLRKLFSQSKYIWSIAGGSILVGLIVAAGFILLIIPGIYWALKYSMTINLIVDKDMGVMEAMRQSAKMTSGVKMALLGFGIVSFGVFILGVICLGVGIFVATPIVWLASVYVYKKLL